MLRKTNVKAWLQRLRVNSPVSWIKFERFARLLWRHNRLQGDDTRRLAVADSTMDKVKRNWVNRIASEKGRRKRKKSGRKKIEKVEAEEVVVYDD